MKHLFAPLVAAGMALGGLASDAHAAASFIFPGTSYLSSADSPFSSSGFNYFHLETFEDHLLNTPGVIGGPGGVTSVVFGSSIHDSVDADDGVIDGSGLLGDSYFSQAGANGVTFTFSAVALGSLPTSVGIVWTDAGIGASVTLKAFGPGGTLLFSETRSGFADNSNNGETAEDRFFGVVDAAGVSSIFISNSLGGIEVDHLQYGLAAAVPEPQTWGLMLAGLATGGWLARRRRRS